MQQDASIRPSTYERRFRMTLIDMISAFVAAALAGTGVGGGGLLVIYLTAIKHIPQADAQAINLVFFISASIPAIIFHARYRHPESKLILRGILLGCIGTIAGGVIRKSISPDSLRLLFGIMLTAAGVKSLFKKKSMVNTRNHPENGPDAS